VGQPSNRQRVHARRSTRAALVRHAVAGLALASALGGLAACGVTGSTATSSQGPAPSTQRIRSTPAFRFAVPASGDHPPAPSICGSDSPPPARFAHVIVIMLENHSYDQLIGPAHSPAAAQAPYLNRLASSCGLAIDYHNVTHPSLPNYLAATGGGTFGITYDCQGCATSAPSVFSQVAAAGGSWAVYAESMPGACQPRDDLAVKYTDHHNPPVFYRSLQASCAANDQPMGTPLGGALISALQSGRLANYVFLAPNRCNDMHDCSIHTGDAWLAWWINTITASRVYRTQPTAIFITVDEGTGGHIGKGEVCAQNPADQSCHVPLVAVSPYVHRHSVDRQVLDHYALLRTTEQLLGLPPLGNAATAPDMRSAIGLRR
jgi:phosphatidylinositol-3-phosphatase